MVSKMFCLPIVGEHDLHNILWGLVFLPVGTYGPTRDAPKTLTESHIENVYFGGYFLASNEKWTQAEMDQ
jgi:hypothetical protein